jgi:voltage-gated potassium channel
MFKLKSSVKEREVLLQKIEKATEMPMLALVVIMVGVLILPLVIKLNHSQNVLFEMIDLVIWAIFCIELSVRVYIAPRRLEYLKKHWLDLILVLLPLLRFFRMFRVVRGARAIRSIKVVRFLRFTRIIFVFTKFTQKLKEIFSRHGFLYLVIIFMGIIIIGTILIYHFEQTSINGTKNGGEILWMVITNAFSGGFANIYPDSIESKALTMTIIILGNVLVSYFTASLASYFTEKDQDIEQERIEKKLNDLMREIASLKKLLK